MFKRSFIPALAVGMAALTVPSAVGAQETEPPIELEPLGTYGTGVFDESASEITAHDPATQRLFVVNAHLGAVDVLDVADPAEPELLDRFSADDALGVSGTEINSVDVHDGIVAAAVEAPVKTDPGWVVFFDTDGELLSSAQVGAQPDSLHYTPGGTYVMTADEGEPADDYSIDPAGTVSIVETATGEVRTADFTRWDTEELPEGVRVFGPEEDLAEPDAVSRNLEPEFVVAADEHTAYVSLQENNAFASLDLDTAEITELHPFGFKDHLLEGNELDASNKDDAVNITDWPVYGIYQPDGIDLYQDGDETYIVTANEGDSRDWDGYSEETRVADLELCADAPRFADYDIDELQAEENLGRLHVTTADGLSEDGSCYEELYSFGGRSFSIWSTDGDLVFDSGSEFEHILAETDPDHFNANNDDNDPDKRSDDKGPEPEDVAIGTIGERTYAFIGLERVGGVMVYDITDPAEATYVTYVTNRDFSAEPGPDSGGDLGPEGLLFIGADDSPTGRPALAVANEVSGTTTLFDITGEAVGDGGNGDGDGDGDQALPETGTGATGLLVGTAAAAVLAGGAVILMRRRRA